MRENTGGPMMNWYSIQRGISRTVAFLINQNEGIRQTTFIYKAQLKLKLSSPWGRDKKHNKIKSIYMIDSVCLEFIEKIQLSGLPIGMPLQPIR